MFTKIKPIVKSSVIKSLVPVIVAAFAVGAIVFAWTEPSVAPPDGNVAPPLNTGSVGQSKGGNLALNTDGVLAYGLLVPFGNVGIGTIDPTQQLHISNSNSDAAILFEQKGPGSTETFNYTGSQKTWVVPAGVTSISVDAQGSAGGAGNGNGGGAGGRGARVQTTLAVTPYETLYIYVGGLGYNGGGAGGTDQDESPLNGGAGGGGSDIRQGGSGINNRVIVAGGGGGGGGGWGGPPAMNGGGGGWSSNIGSPGLNGQGTSNICTTAAVGGEGASQAAVGIGGPKSSGNNGDAGGGGGGGYRGGGGGGGYSSYGDNGSNEKGGAGGRGNDGVACAGAGGGGGSSYANPSKTSNTAYTNGYSTGNGKIIISYSVSTWPWTMGVDQSDSGKFKISNSDALGTGDKLIMDTTGDTTINGLINGIRMISVSGGSPVCSAGTVALTKKWSSRTCTQTGRCAGNCTTAAGWSASTPTCLYGGTYLGGGLCTWNTQTCTADSWSKAICMGD